MILEDLRAEALDAAKEMSRSGLVRAASGNVSVRDPASGLVAITPSGLTYESLMPEDMVIIDLDGRVVEGRQRPSSETPMHLAVYRARQDVRALMHTHSPYATAYGVTGKPLPCLTVPLAVYGPVPVVLFELPGSEALGDSCVVALGSESMALLLQNHGVLTLGRSAREALEIALYVEEGAQVALLCESTGASRPIPDRLVDEIKRRWKAGKGQ